MAETSRPLGNVDSNRRLSLRVLPQASWASVTAPSGSAYGNPRFVEELLSTPNVLLKASWVLAPAPPRFGSGDTVFVNVLLAALNACPKFTRAPYRLRPALSMETQGVCMSGSLRRRLPPYCKDWAGCRDAQGLRGLVTNVVVQP